MAATSHRRRSPGGWPRAAAAAAPDGETGEGTGAGLKKFMESLAEMVYRYRGLWREPNDNVRERLQRTGQHGAG